MRIHLLRIYPLLHFGLSHTQLYVAVLCMGLLAALFRVAERGCAF